MKRRKKGEQDRKRRNDQEAEEKQEVKCLWARTGKGKEGATEFSRRSGFGLSGRGLDYENGSKNLWRVISDGQFIGDEENGK